MEAPRDWSSPIKDLNLPEIPFVEGRLWKEDYANILQSRIWDHDKIQFITLNRPGPASLTHACPDDIIHHEALIWANDTTELRSLVRLTGYVIIGGTLSGSTGTRPIHDFCGIKAEFAGNQHRTIGIRTEPDGNDWQPGHCVSFNIDGNGGEVVTEISVAMHEAPKAIKLRTNRGREVYWGEEQAQNWNTLRASHGMTLIGIVMTFANASGFSWDSKTYVSRSFIRYETQG